MKVLVAHNFYSSDSPSGENDAVLQDVELLGSAGVEVLLYGPSSDGISVARADRLRLAAAQVIPLRRGFGDLQAAMRSFRPDVLHVHNVVPGISWPEVARAQRAVPTVQTLHNYRLTCLSGMHTLGGQRCLRCDGTRRVLPGVTRACYRDSRPQSALMTVARAVNAGAMTAMAGYVVLTPFQRDYVLRRLPDFDGKILLRPSPVPRGPHDRRPIPGRFAFAGRIDAGKGVDALMAGWDASAGAETGRLLTIMGSGPLEATVARWAEGRSDVNFLGRVEESVVLRTMSQAVATVIPSSILEGYPRVLAQALSQSCPVIVANNENLRSTVHESYAWVSAALPESLDQAFAAADGNVGVKDAAALAWWTEHLEPTRSTTHLVDFYEGVAA